MTLVDLDSWQFKFRHDSALEKALGTAREPEILELGSAVEFVEYLSNDTSDEYGRLHMAIDKQLKGDKGVMALKRLRSPLNTLRHFPKYRGTKYDHYHRASRAIAANCATADQHLMVSGLDAEISGSSIILKPGQVLFHGRCDDHIVANQPYPTFISSTINPVVARNSAFRRAGMGNTNGRPVVFVLTLAIPLKALWGHVGRSAEWELLLPRNVAWRETGRSTGRMFDVIQAEAF